MGQGQNRSGTSRPGLFNVSIAIDTETVTQFGNTHGRQAKAPVPVIGVGGEDPAGSPSERGGRKVSAPDAPHVTTHLSASRGVKAADQASGGPGQWPTGAFGNPPGQRRGQAVTGQRAGEQPLPRAALGPAAVHQTLSALCPAFDP